MRICSEMPFHSGIVLRIYPSRDQKRIIAVNDGCDKVVYNRLVALNNERYTLSKTADIVPSYRDRIAYKRERAYYLDGVAIAKNRRQRFEQEGKALSDLSLSRQEISRLRVKKSTRYYNNPKRLMPGAEFLYHGDRYVMSGQHCRDAYFRTAGAETTNFPARECRIIRKNRGLVYIA